MSSRDSDEAYVIDLCDAITDEMATTPRSRGRLQPARRRCVVQVEEDQDDPGGGRIRKNKRGDVVLERSEANVTVARSCPARTAHAT